jgi:hypothetical protein
MGLPLVDVATGTSLPFLLAEPTFNGGSSAYVGPGDSQAG